MAFSTAPENFLLNSVLDYPVTFRDAAGVEQTTTANVIANAVTMDIHSVGTFNLADIKGASALRGHGESFQTSTLAEADVTYTAPTTVNTNINFKFDVRDFSYSSQTARHSLVNGKTPNYAVTAEPGDTIGNIFAKLFVAVSGFTSNAPKRLDSKLIKVIVPTGARMSGVYTDGTTFTNTVLTADFDGVSYTGTGLTGPIKTITSIDHGTVANPSLRFVAVGNQMVFGVTLLSDVRRQPSLNLRFNNGALTQVNSSSPGRATDTWLRQNRFLSTPTNTEYYYPENSNQQPHSGFLYTSIYFSEKYTKLFKGSLSAVDATHEAERSVSMWIKEDATNLAADAVLAKVIAFLMKAGRADAGYNLSIADFANPTSAIKDVVVSGTAAWNTATTAKVVRPDSAALAADITAFIA